MAARIEKQDKEIEQLRVAGLDTTTALRKLSLMKHAMEEMRLQLGQLSPTTGDRKRPNGPADNPSQAAHKK